MGGIPDASLRADGPLARLHRVWKRFGEVAAVRGVDLTLARGEIHALLGENGAGKTTLMSILAGLHLADAGQIELDGQVVSLRHPGDAMAAGIGMVHQHFMLVPTLSVAENVLLGAARQPVLLRPRRLERAVQAAAARLGLTVDAGARVATLSIGEQQRVEILRVLLRGARVMILDEPTAILSPSEAGALHASLRRLADEGRAVVLISHRLEELRRVADRITVMRRGAVVGHFDRPSTCTVEELAAAMVGGEVSLHLDRPLLRRGATALDVAGLRVLSDRGRLAVRGLSLTLRQGEIVGLAGISGHGQGELLEALAGLRPAIAGQARLGGEEITHASARIRTDRGLRFIPEDRQHVGTAPGLTVGENLQLRCYRHPPARRGLWLDLRADEARLDRRVAELQIATTGLGQMSRLLSGGNLQKVILARELDEAAQVILAMHPTRGLDAWATMEVRRLFLRAREGGAAVLLCSEDLEEILALSDRIVVMVQGRLVYEVDHDQADLTEIGRQMVTVKEPDRD